MSPFKNPLTTQNVVGGALMLFGMALSLWMKWDNTLTMGGLIACLVMVAAGAYIMLPTLLHSLIGDFSSAANPFVPVLRSKVEQSGRRATDPEVVTTEVEAVVPVEATATVPPPRVIQPELVQRPPEARPTFEPLADLQLQPDELSPTPALNITGQPPEPAKERRRPRAKRVTVQEPGAPQPPSEHAGEQHAEGYDP